MNTAQIEQSVRRLYEAQQEKKKFDEYYDEVRKKNSLQLQILCLRIFQKEKRHLTLN